MDNKDVTGDEAKTNSVPVGTSYNLNEAIFKLLGELQNKVFYFRNDKRNYYRAFENAKSMKITISAHLDDDEKKELLKIEKKFKEKIDYKIPAYDPFISNKPYIDRAQRLEQGRKKEILDEYMEKLNEFMKKYKISTTNAEKKFKLG